MKRLLVLTMLLATQVGQASECLTLNFPTGPKSLCTQDRVATPCLSGSNGICLGYVSQIRSWKKIQVWSGDYKWVSYNEIFPQVKALKDIAEGDVIMTDYLFGKVTRLFSNGTVEVKTEYS